ncbi:hypothetical protein C5167_006412 [Papaver somniferum]|uniref:BAH domain-containing protein n=1 Tax=Papaver somniferum TaxID=3469 RepID=A0A4Y7JD93_PAPSO|nr:uncharacterized protein LOC113276400 [Papaver somniferum]RZC59114.1 hypothetical protein C5167_006412 [Papaver somniferum]
MHGREGGEVIRNPIRHMWSVLNLGSKIVAADSSIPSSSSEFFCKDGRKVTVGDCALFKPHQESSPPFIGIIRSLTSEEEDHSKFRVNWLYRPVDVNLGKGVLLEAAPNEVFYSFHEDEIPAASLLHPCKVAFLRKGVELPSGISSFVCRRVYDTTNKRLWWLTDQDYINERQEEVDKLLDKTRIEMHAAVQSGGRSPKPLNVSTSAQQLKPGSDSIQNSPSTLPSQIKGKKRERSDQSSEPIKRERYIKSEDGDSGQFIWKSEISKIAEKGGLVDFKGVEKLVRLLQDDSTEKKLELGGRIMAAEVIGATERNDCLGQFVQLNGLAILDEWLREMKERDGSSPKESDKQAEDFLLALLRALDKLPVDLHALQNCNVGRSVNHLRTHKNLEIQKKSKSLVDTWKKRVEAEMKIIEMKSGAARAASSPSKQCISDISHAGSRRTGVSSECIAKSSMSQPSATKAASLRLGQGDGANKTSPGSVKSSVPLLSAAASSKDLNGKLVHKTATPDPSVTVKEEKSSGSSQSLNNSQSSWKEDARSSTAGSMSVSKTSGSASRHRKSANGFPGSVVSGVQKETSINRCISGNRNAASEKTSQSGSTCEKTPDVPAADHGNHRLIVRLPNPGRSPARSVSISSLDDPSALVSRVSSPGVPESSDQSDRKVKVKCDVTRVSVATDVTTESWQSSDVKGGLVGSDVGNGSADGITGEEAGKLSEPSKIICSSSGIEQGVAFGEPKQGKLKEASLSSINALVESCVKASASICGGDDIGMNLLASVAAGEMSKSEQVSPISSPKKCIGAEPECVSNDPESRLSCEDGTGRLLTKPEASLEKQVASVDSLKAKDEVRDGKILTMPVSEEKPKEEQLQVPGINLQQMTNPCLKSDRIAGEALPASVKHEGVEQSCEKRTGVSGCKDERTVLSGLSAEVVKEAVVDSPFCPSLDMNVQEGSNCDIRTKKKMMSGVDIQELGERNTMETLPSENVLHLENCAERDEVLEAKALIGHTEYQRMEQISTDNSAHDNRISGTAGSSVLGHSGVDGNNADRKVGAGGHSKISAPDEELPSVSVQGTEVCAKPSEAEELEECASTTGGSSLYAAAGSDTATKLDFDLNEGIPLDEGNQGDGTPVPGDSPAPNLPSTLQFSLPSISCSLPASITVAAAAKGGFLPPIEHLSRSKGEIGWKGSAATSAFRRAEPRKVLEMSLCAADVPQTDSAFKQGLRLLNFDLNVADERVLEDTGSQNYTHGTHKESGYINHRDLGRSEMIGPAAPGRSAFAGLDLDLNRVNEDTDISSFSMSSSRRLEVPLLPVRSSSSSGVYSNGEVNVLRDFDLNNGPGVDELSAEPTVVRQHAKGNLPFLAPVGQRMNNMEMGGLSSWFPMGNSYPAVAVPSILPERGEQHYPVVSAAGTPRIVGPSAGGTNFGLDVYRGPPVLASSPAVAYSAAAAYQYPGFPFGTSFALPSTSFSGGSATYLDTSAGAGLGFTAVPSQLLGPPTAGHYHRPYVISVPEGSSNAGSGPESSSNSRKWGRQGGLDLNAGPGGSDMEVGREDRYPSAASRQQPVAISSQAFLTQEQGRMYYNHQAAAALKRKEPEGGWDMERFNYKQQQQQQQQQQQPPSSWQQQQ